MLKHNKVTAQALQVMTSLLLGVTPFLASYAAPTNANEVYKGDWLAVCDNLGVCRAAGYQPESGSRPVSVLLTIDNDSNNLPSGSLRLLDPSTDAAPKNDPSMHIGLKNLGLLEKSTSKSEAWSLSSEQVRALIDSAPYTEYVVFKEGAKQWDLSTNGLSAALLKIDDLQKRLNTPSALSIRHRGDRQRGPSTHQVTNNNFPTPVKSGGLRLTKQEISGLATSTECSTNFNKKQVDQHPLTAVDVLLEHPCWDAAYNTGLVYIHAHKNADRSLSLLQVTASGSGYSDGTIYVRHKERGLGDCWFMEDWAWDGRSFVRSYAGSTGLCRGFAGGAWTIPSFSLK